MRRLWMALMVLGAAYSGTARADTFYVAMSGSDSNPGTEAAPFATLNKAQMVAAAGDTVFVHGGTYKFAGAVATGVKFDKSGRDGAPIEFFAVMNELPILDFSGLNAQDRIRGFHVTGSYLHFKGFELTGVKQIIDTAHESWGIYNEGSNNTYEQLNIHHIQGPGLFIAKGGNNLVLNCDSHHNFDPKSSNGAGENADGFGCHIPAGGKGNVFRGCRAWWNTDDGYDFISAAESCTVEASWSFYNGFLPDTFTGQGNGSGFKAGGYGSNTPPASPPRHTVRFCLAFRNRASGFYANHHPVGVDMFSNTAWNNPRNFDMLGSADHKLRNNVALAPGEVIANWTGKDDASNAWTLPVMVTDADFMSVSDADVMAARKSDGSLPDLPFMKLAAGSDLIDVGVDVGFPFSGKAPDLGAFEVGLATPPTGAAGSGGAAASGAAGAGPSGAAGAGGMGAAAAGGGMGAAAAGGGMGAAAGGRPASAGVGGAVGPGGATGRGVTAGQGTTTGATSQSGAAAAGSGAVAGSATSGAEGPQASDEGCGCNLARRNRRNMGALSVSVALLLVFRSRQRRKTRR